MNGGSITFYQRKKQSKGEFFMNDLSVSHFCLFVSGPSLSEVSSTPSVMLRQSSWASREAVNSGSGNPNDGKSFNLNKTLWEKRSTTEEIGAGSTGTSSLRGGFRSNRDFWNQRVAIQQKQKQTPDLVLDLPSKPKPRPRGSGSGPGSSGSHPDSMSSSTSSSSGDETLLADNFAKPDRNTLRKSGSKPDSSQEMSSPAENGDRNNSKRIPPVQARLLQKKSPPEQ